MPSKKRVPKLIRCLVGIQISRLHFAKYVGNLLELGSAPLRYYSSVEAYFTSRWERVHHYVTLGKSGASVTVGHQSRVFLAEFPQRHVIKTIVFVPT